VSFLNSFNSHTLLCSFLSPIYFHTNDTHTHTHTHTHTAHSTQHTAHSTQHTAHSTQHTAHSTQQHTAHSTQHTAHSTQHTAHSTQHTAHNGKILNFNEGSVVCCFYSAIVLQAPVCGDVGLPPGVCALLPPLLPHRAGTQR
jgi:hypothetical protein